MNLLHPWTDLWLPLWLCLWLLHLWRRHLSLRLPPHPCWISKPWKGMYNQMCLVCRRHPDICYLW